PKEIDDVVGSDGLAFRSTFNVTTTGNFEGGTNVLEAVKPVGSDLDAARAKLLAHRARRVPPGRDDKVLAGWNGLAIRGLAFASRVFGKSEWAAMAARAAEFVVTKMRASDGALFRSWQGGGRLTG